MPLALPVQPEMPRTSNNETSDPEQPWCRATPGNDRSVRRASERAGARAGRGLGADAQRLRSPVAREQAGRRGALRGSERLDPERNAAHAGSDRAGAAERKKLGRCLPRHEVAKADRRRDARSGPRPLQPRPTPAQLRGLGTSAKPPARGRLLSRTRAIGPFLGLLNHVSQAVRKQLRYHPVPESIQMSIGREKRALAPLLNIAKRRQSLDVQNRLATEPGDEMLLEDVERRARRALGVQYLASLGNNHHHELRSQAERLPSREQDQLLRDPEGFRFSLDGGRHRLDHTDLAHHAA